jgi:hypothetical protein
MQNRLDRVAIAVEPGKQSVDWHDSRKISFGDITLFVSGAETIDDDAIGTALFVQARREPNR